MTPRAVALALGIFFGVLTASELALGEWSPGGVLFLDRTTKANLIHWVVALALLGTYFAGSSASRTACRIVGMLFAILAVWGLLSAVSLGGALGYSGEVPVSYQVIHGLTAVVALTTGFRRSKAV